MGIVPLIQEAVVSAVRDLTGAAFEPEDIPVTETKPEFEGDYTVVLFGLLRSLGPSGRDLAEQLGRALTDARGEIAGYQVVKGFLNLTISDGYWLRFLRTHFDDPAFGQFPRLHKRLIVEYSSPNTNKPLHLGHLRNNFLGWSMAEIFKACGYDVVKTSILNDRGIHICKSMVAWQRYAEGMTPEKAGVKGDHFVGDYYVRFGQAHQEEMNLLMAEGKRREEAEAEAPIMQEAREMLRRWEAGDPATLELWRMMNGWVYEGFEATYKRIGSDFDKTYYESEIYLLGKQMVQDGLEKGIFYRKADGSVWIDLRDEGLDEKIVQRSDGTAVYITQDIGLAWLKQQDFPADRSIYVVGNEQDYHFKVLQLIAKKLEIPGAQGIHHLSYGMVELPTGRMKTREGTVVDADDLLDEMEAVAEKHTRELGKVEGFGEQELKQLFATLGQGALKFFLLRVNPKKKMVFHPEESIDFHGFTGPFVQYTYARTRSILRKAAPAGTDPGEELDPAEKKILVELEKFPGVISQAAAEYDPSVIAVYVFRLAQTFNSFLSEKRVLTAESAAKKELRLQLAQCTASVIRRAMGLLGIAVPEQM